VHGRFVVTLVSGLQHTGIWPSAHWYLAFSTLVYGLLISLQHTGIWPSAHSVSPQWHSSAPSGNLPAPWPTRREGSQDSSRCRCSILQNGGSPETGSVHAKSTPKPSNSCWAEHVSPDTDRCSVCAPAAAPASTPGPAPCLAACPAFLPFFLWVQI